MGELKVGDFVRFSGSDDIYAVVGFDKNGYGEKVAVLGIIHKYPIQAQLEMLVKVDLESEPDQAEGRE